MYPFVLEACRLNRAHYFDYLSIIFGTFAFEVDRRFSAVLVQLSHLSSKSIYLKPRHLCYWSLEDRETEVKTLACPEKYCESVVFESYFSYFSIHFHVNTQCYIFLLDSIIFIHWRFKCLIHTTWLTQTILCWLYFIFTLWVQQ
jgi:hypothetical protein